MLLIRISHRLTALFCKHSFVINLIDQMLLNSGRSGEEGVGCGALGPPSNAQQREEPRGHRTDPTHNLRLQDSRTRWHITLYYILINCKRGGRGGQEVV